MEKIKAELILEDGLRFSGKAFGHIHEAIGEVIFSTGMTGYQEELTNPSYAGQIVNMTFPLIGNYGTNNEDIESDKVYLKGFIVRELCEVPNNWRCEKTLEDFLIENKVMGLEGIDTRALTRHLRDNGTMKGIITTENLSDESIKEKLNSFSNADVVKNATPKEKYILKGDGINIAVIDLGSKKSVIEGLNKMGCNVTVYPAFTPAEEILDSNPQCVLITDGPGNPMDITEVIENVKKLTEKNIPIMGVSLGHQILALALGCETSKLKFGHQGCNYPVKNIKTGKVSISSENHEYIVSKVSDDVEITYTNVNDSNIEGIKHKTKPFLSVQFQCKADFIYNKITEIIKGDK